MERIVKKRTKAVKSHRQTKERAGREKQCRNIEINKEHKEQRRLSKETRK
jgi:hypothetical protein